MNPLLFCVLSIGLMAFAAHRSHAQTAEEFYNKTKELSFILSASVGGGYSSYARVLANHWGRFIPGNPAIIVQNMPGGGGLRATNFLYNNAPKDGAVIGLVNASTPLAPLYGLETARFDSTKFNWLGSLNRSRGICIAWHAAPIKNWKDMLDNEFIVGGSGAGSDSVNRPAVLNAIFGTKIKVISGYSGGIDVFLAMERGEVHGRCGGLLTPIRTTRPEWLTNKKINVTVQIALERSPLFPDVPSVMEFVTNDRDRAILELVFAPQDMDKPMLAPPNVPEDRVALLRRSLMAALNDEQFRSDAEKQRLDLDPLDGDALTNLMNRLYQISPDVVADARKIMRSGGAETPSE